MDDQLLEAMRVIRNRPPFVRQPWSKTREDYEVSRGLPWRDDDLEILVVDNFECNELQGIKIPW